MEQILQAALQEGCIPHKDDKFLFHGPGGVGKSSLIKMFLGTKRSLVRISTPLAIEPIHLTPVRDVSTSTPVRDVSTSTYTTNWEKVNYDHSMCMIANTSKEMYTAWVDERRSKKGKKAKSGATNESAPSAGKVVQQAAYLAPPGILKSHKRFDIHKITENVRKFFKKSTLAASTLSTSLGDDPDKIEEFLTEFQKGIQDLMKSPAELKEVLVSHSIRIVDSGGQPQFHDLVSIFIPELSGLVSVFKLSEPLAAPGEVVIYDDGKAICSPYKSHYTNEQVIRHDLQAIHSEATQCGLEHMPSVAFVGTHIDLQQTCSETPDEKDERLHTIIMEILPKEMQKSVIASGGSLRQVTFRVNARKPQSQDYQKVEQLKDSLVKESRVESRDLPLKWHGYEVALHLLMEKLQRQSLSREECEFVGHKLCFDPASLNAALKYLRQLNIIDYYDVLPNVIFGSSQVVLDKISELVRYSLELKNEGKAIIGVQRKFLQQGIVSLELLQSSDLSKHYTVGLFEPRDLLKVLVSKLVVSNVGKDEYIMPSVLQMSSIHSLPSLPNGSMRSSFILHFSRKSPMFGIYCCTVSSLISDAGWNLLTKRGEVVQVARNSITFEVPNGLPGKLTFLDPLSSYLEVVLELPVHVAEEHSMTLYPEIRNAFITAVKKSMETLHYEVRAPEVSFMCPGQSGRCSVSPHLATLDDRQSCLKCSLEPGTVSHHLSEDQRMWLINGAGIYVYS